MLQNLMSAAVVIGASRVNGKVALQILHPSSRIDFIVWSKLCKLVHVHVSIFGENSPQLLLNSKNAFNNLLYK